MGRANSRKYYGAEVVDPWKRERQTRHQAPPPTLPNVDVYGVLFAVVAVVAVVYPLMQWALGR